MAYVIKLRRRFTPCIGLYRCLGNAVMALYDVQIASTHNRTLDDWETKYSILGQRYSVPTTYRPLTDNFMAQDFCLEHFT